MAISMVFAVLAAIVFIAILMAIALAKYILNRIEETDKQVETAIRNMAELKKHFEELESRALNLDKKTLELAMDIGKLYVASHEECR